MIRTERWKHIRYPKIDTVQLFELAADPNAMRDLAADPKHANILEQLRMQIDMWLRQHGDPLMTSNEASK